MLCAVTLLGKVLHTLQTTDASVLSLRQLGLIVFGCWTLLRFKEAIVKSFVDESLQVSFAMHHMTLHCNPHGLNAYLAGYLLSLQVNLAFLLHCTSLSR